MMHVDGATSKMLEILVTGAEAYPAMERLILESEHQLCISLHALSFETSLTSREALAAGLDNWCDLLLNTAARGVEIYLLLTDFDPVGTHQLHAQVWNRADVLFDALKAAPIQIAEKFHIQIAFPGGRAGVILQQALWLFVRRKAAELIDGTSPPARHPPGLADLLTKDNSIRPTPSKPLFSQTFHQKFLIADNTHSIIGGLDVDPRRFDNPRHDRDAEETWHDVDIEIKGPVVRDICRHFQHSWSTAKKDGFSFLPQHLARYYPRMRYLSAASHLEFACLEGEANDAPCPQIEFVATAGQQKPGLLSWGSEKTTTDIEKAHIQLIGSAQHQIYIETQFLRSTPIIDALIEAGKRNPSLSVILLLPAAPEDVAFGGDRSSIQRYGEWLQIKGINRLRRCYGDRFGAFCLTNDLKRAEHEERDALFGHAMVYIHSKVMLADNAIGVVSSANLNGRSLRWDFEAGLVIRAPEIITRLRNRLWSCHLSNAERDVIESLPLEEGISLWRKKAEQRAALKERAKGVGAVPFPYQKTARFSFPMPFVTENMV